MPKIKPFLVDLDFYAIWLFQSPLSSFYNTNTVLALKSQVFAIFKLGYVLNVSPSIVPSVMIFMVAVEMPWRVHYHAMHVVMRLLPVFVCRGASVEAVGVRIPLSIPLSFREVFVIVVIDNCDLSLGKLN